MHIITRLDLLMDALTASKAALWYVKGDSIPGDTGVRVDRALKKIEKAFEAVNGTEERPGT